MKGRKVAGFAVVAVLVAAWIFTGCGSGSDSSSTASATSKPSESTAAETSSGPLTKAEFVKQANAICRKGVEKKEEAILELAKVSAKEGKPPSPQALGKVGTVVVFPTYNDILDQISELEPPKGGEAAVEKMLQTYRGDLESAEAEPIKATRENFFTEANDAGEAYGLSCRF